MCLCWGGAGALMGLLGAWLVALLVAWGEGDRVAQQQRGVNLILCVINCVFIISLSMVPYIDWAAHVGGMLGGML